MPFQCRQPMQKSALSLRRSLRAYWMSLNNWVLRSGNLKPVRMLLQLQQDAENHAIKGAAPAHRSLTTKMWSVGNVDKKGTSKRTAVQKRKRRGRVQQGQRHGEYCYWWRGICIHHHVRQ